MKVVGKIKKGLACTVMVLAMYACEDFVDIPAPQTELVWENVFKNDATATATVSDIYGQMSSAYGFASGDGSSVTQFMAVYADELISYNNQTTSSGLTPFYLNAVVPANAITTAMWRDAYAMIFKANRILEGLNAPNTISSALLPRLKGEALFIRAFCHFYLVNVFGDVPLILTSDYRANTSVSRTPSDDVYGQIIDDLVQAKSLLPDTYAGTGRFRPNKSTASALLARTYLYTNAYELAEAEATEVITNPQYTLLPDLNAVFLKSSAEAIWQLLPQGGTNLYTFEGRTFILLAPPANVALRASIVNVYEAGDVRRANWIGSYTSESGLTTWYFAHKYKQNGGGNATGAEASMVLRLAEQYLIRAEARARQNKFSEATDDINIIRARANLDPVTLSGVEALVTEILSQRRLELFTEWGHRFFDLRRTGKLDEVLGPIKPNWTSTDSLLPIPQSEMLVNTNLTQNPGYQ